MELEITLFAGLKCNNPALSCFGDTEFRLAAGDGMTVGELRKFLEIDPNMRLLVMVNHHNKQEGWILKDNDRVAIFPPIGGG